MKNPIIEPSITIPSKTTLNISRSENKYNVVDLGGTYSNYHDLRKNLCVQLGRPETDDATVIVGGSSISRLVFEHVISDGKNDFVQRVGQASAWAMFG